MPELVSVTNIDLVVHLEYERVFSKTHTRRTKEATNRLQRCKDRVKSLAEDPRSLLFYFSASMDRNEEGDLVKTESVNKEVYQDEIDRIRDYQDLLGSRFFLFGCSEIPDSVYLTLLLLQNGFAYSTDETTLTAYGEYTELCVDAVLRDTVKALELKPENYTVNEELSLSARSIFNFHPFPAPKIMNNLKLYFKSPV